jgi:hypothetical protein
MTWLVIAAAAVAWFAIGCVVGYYLGATEDRRVR